MAELLEDSVNITFQGIDNANIQNTQNAQTNKFNFITKFAQLKLLYAIVQ